MKTENPSQNNRPRITRKTVDRTVNNIVQRDTAIAATGDQLGFTDQEVSRALDVKFETTKEK